MKQQQQKTISELQTQLREILNQQIEVEDQIKKLLLEKREVKLLIAELETEMNGCNKEKYCYSFNACGDVGQVFGYDFKCSKRLLEIDSLTFDAIAEYFEEVYCAIYDRDLNSFFIWDAEAIVINEDGDVYQEGNFFIDHNDYSNVSERNELIEKHMDKTGVYPGVYLSDYYGNLTAIKTN